MEKETVKDRAKRELEGILSIEWTAKKLAEFYLDGTILKFRMFTLWSPEPSQKPGDVRILPDGLEKRLGEKTLKELKSNYNMALIRRVCSALEFFNVLEKGPAIDLMGYAKDNLKAVKYFSTKYRKIIRAANMMLDKSSSLYGL